MLDEKALILIAHSDSRTLVALYTLLDAEGYFVAPCFSRGDLLKYCSQYAPGSWQTVACMKRHSNRISQVCRKVVQAEGVPAGNRR